MTGPLIMEISATYRLHGCLLIRKLHGLYMISMSNLSICIPCNCVFNIFSSKHGLSLDYSGSHKNLNIVNMYH